MSKVIWIKSTFQGVRYKKHPTRKKGVKFDRYFVGYYKVSGKRMGIGFGWASEGWSESEVYNRIQIYKKNAKRGIKPMTLKDEAAEKDFEREEIKNQSSPDNPDNITFSRFYETHYKTYAKADKGKTTADKESSYFNVWLLPRFGDQPIKKITDADLEDLKFDMLDKGRSPRTIEQCFAIFNSFWSYSIKQKIVNTNSPAKIVKKPRVENECKRFFSVEEATKILARLKRWSKQTHDITLLSIHTGARRGEIFNLTWSVVDMENKTIELRDAKGKPRHAYMTDEVFEMFKRRYRRQKPSTLVFINSRGSKFTEIPESFSTTIKKLKLNDGVEDRRDRAVFHTCRHTFGSWHVQNGTGLYEVKELMGHSSIKVTERYAHLKPGGLKKAATRFNKIVERIMPPL